MYVELLGIDCMTQTLNCVIVNIFIVKNICYKS